MMNGLNSDILLNLKGLSNAEAQERLKKFGYNELPASQRRTIFYILKEVLTEPMFVLLLALSGIYFAI
ncbi:MAG: cation-transporting P-type ATPase, partial [candidate division WOR-3 bacterium]|nr:cation-transporting P-type ATPase [candidate division WOR-3 bacterium]